MCCVFLRLEVEGVVRNNFNTRSLSFPHKKIKTKFKTDLETKSVQTQQESRAWALWPSWQQREEPFGCADKPAEKHCWLICCERKILFRLEKTS
jgi:hypothetical protein